MSDLGTAGRKWRESQYAVRGWDPKPRTITIVDYLLMIAQTNPGRVRRVPARAVVESGLDGEGFFSLVTCPCGARPVARIQLKKCPGCERHYVDIAEGTVYVAYGDGPLPS
jgi:hypothetical protein